MFDAKSLLNSLLGSQTAAAVETRATAMLAQGQSTLGTVGGSVSDALTSVQAQLSGTQAGAVIGQAGNFIAENKGVTGAALAGLGALLLGTSAGRSALGGATKLGALGAIGGLAYKAFTNHQAGKPLTEGIPILDQLTAAPAGSGFHEDDHSHDAALLMVRTAIATAAADGVVDAGQRAQILKEMQTVGLPPAAANFLDAEIAKPATIPELTAAAAGSKELGLQIYAAGRFVASAGSAPEQSFLKSLATALGLDAGLVGQVDAAAMHT